MEIALTSTQIAGLLRFVKSSEDCEALMDNEYIIDLYDIEKPICIDAILTKTALIVEGAAYMLFDEESQGYYMGERIDDESVILYALNDAGAFDA